MGLMDSFKDTGNLIKNTFTIIGKNPQIVKATIAQAVFAFVFFALALVGVLFMIFSEALAPAGIIMLIIALLFFAFVYPFVRMYYRASQCWIVYNTFTGKKSHYKEGISRARQNKWDIFVLGFFDIIINFFVNKLRQGKGFLSMILGKILEEVWDVVGNFLLPAAIIQDKSVRETLPELKNLKNNIPGALMGALGFDFAGNLIRRFVNYILIFVLIIFGILPLYWFNTWTPFVIVLIIILGINIMMSLFVDMIKVIYFTLFYMSVSMPNKISAAQKKEVTNYLMSGVKKK